MQAGSTYGWHAAAWLPDSAADAGKSGQAALLALAAEDGVTLYAVALK